MTDPTKEFSDAIKSTVGGISKTFFYTAVLIGILAFAIGCAYVITTYKTPGFVGVLLVLFVAYVLVTVAQARDKQEKANDEE